MYLYDEKNWDKFLDIIPIIKNELNEWKVVHFKVEDLAGDTIDAIAAKICKITEKWQGAAFVYSENEILMLAKTGEHFDKTQFSADLEAQLVLYKCKVKTQNVTFEGIAKVEVILKHKIKSHPHKKSLFLKREQRSQKTIMIAEDDALTRMMLTKTIAKYGRVIEMKNGKGVLEKYLMELPDAVLLDINLPHISGIKILERIMNADPDAYIVIISGEDNADNIQNVIHMGAKAFIPKPITPEKIETALKACPTL